MTPLEFYKALADLVDRANGNAELERACDKLRDVLDIVWYSNLTHAEREGFGMDVNDGS